MRLLVEPYGKSVFLDVRAEDNNDACWNFLLSSCWMLMLTLNAVALIKSSGMAVSEDPLGIQNGTSCK